MTVIRFETELCTGRIFLKWVLTKGLPKVYFDGFKGATITIMSSSIWTVCRRTVGAVGFYHLKTIQPSPSLTDNIRSGSKKSSYKSTWMALRERPEPLWASAFELFAEGRLSPSDFIILNPKHRQVSRDIRSKGALQALSGSLDCDFWVTFHRIWNDNNSRSTGFFCPFWKTIDSGIFYSDFDAATPNNATRQHWPFQ